MWTQHYSGWNILPMPQGQAFFLVSQLSTSLHLGLCCTLLWVVMEGLEIESGFQLSLLYCWLKKNIEEFSLQMDFLVLLSVSDINGCHDNQALPSYSRFDSEYLVDIGTCCAMSTPTQNFTASNHFAKVFADVRDLTVWWTLWTLWTFWFEGMW